MKLDQSSNWVDDITDQVAAIHRVVQPADQSSPDPEALVVGASPFEYIAGTAPEMIYISGGIVSAVERWSETEEEWVVITGGLPISVMLPPSGQLRVTYMEAPAMVRDACNFNNAAGITEELTPQPSPWEIEAGGRAIVLYISGGAVDAVTRNGVSIVSQLPATVVVPRGGAVVIDYNTDPPLVVKDS